MRQSAGVTLTELTVLVFLSATFALIFLAGCRDRQSPPAADKATTGTAPADTTPQVVTRPRELNARYVCMTNIRHIGIAMNQYAADHDGEFPMLVDVSGTPVPAVDYETGNINTTDPARSAFAILMKEGYLTTFRVFVCPASGDRMPDKTFPTDFAEAEIDEIILSERNCSYGWDPTKRLTAHATCALIADAPPDEVKLVDEGTAKNNSRNHDGTGQNVWYNDGHIMFRKTTWGMADTDTDIYLGEEGYERSDTDAKIIR